ncbi:MAG: GTP-binding protein [Planctomycetales bacterium]|nr:GTP-binding protein [Planctomycetales bacterium]
MTPRDQAIDDDYRAALAAVRRAIERFAGCSNEERASLASDLSELEEMARKLETGRVEIVVFGEISTGKSALINALIGDAVSEVNVQGGWTKDVWHQSWSGAGYCVPGFADSQVVLVDTPGLNEVDGAGRAEIARAAAQRADLILFVTDSDLNETEYSALVELAASHKPILLILNKTDLYSRTELNALSEMFHGPRYAALVDQENILFCRADPKETEYVIESADGSTRSQWRKPSPDVESVRIRALEVLEREGKSLLALNGAMYAADKSDRMAALRIQMRERKAQSMVWSYAVVKSIAVAINPLPLVDVVGGSAVDVTMVVNLAKVYGIELTSKNARALVESILKAAGWVMLGEAVTSYASSFFKGLTLGHGTVLTALPQGAAAGYGSYIVGQAARYYFEHGASWGSESPKTVVTRILDTTEKESVLRRLKEEIKAKIRLNPYADGKTR